MLLCMTGVSPFSDKHGRIHQHRLVMEKHIGRYLTKDEVVHHIDENPKNNDISKPTINDKTKTSKLSYWKRYVE